MHSIQKQYRQKADMLITSVCGLLGGFSCFTFPFYVNDQRRTSGTAITACLLVMFRLCASHCHYFVLELTVFIGVRSLRNVSGSSYLKFFQLITDVWSSAKLTRKHREVDDSAGATM